MATPDPHTARRVETFDFDLHGRVGIRLLDPSQRDIAAVKRQLGPIDKPLSRNPDLHIRFVDQLKTNGPLRLVSVGESGFDDDSFFVLRGKHKSRVRVHIPFDQIGGDGERDGELGCEIICESGLPAVPLMLPILNLTALSRGLTPLHASAFLHRGAGVMATGWAKGGKTETLLAFAAHGAKYVGDEWVYLDALANQVNMFGVPEPIRLWHWHLAQLPHIRRTVSRRRRAKLRLLQLITRSLGRKPSNTNPNRSAWKDRLTPLLERQQYVQIPPSTLFGEEGLCSSAPLDKVVFSLSAEGPEVVVERTDPEDVAKRMVHSLHEERKDFLSYYSMFRFAFPDRTNLWLDRVGALEYERLLSILKGKEAYLLRHPYPVGIEKLFRALNAVF